MCGKIYKKVRFRYKLYNDTKDMLQQACVNTKTFNEFNHFLKGCFAFIIKLKIIKVYFKVYILNFKDVKCDIVRL